MKRILLITAVCMIGIAGFSQDKTKKVETKKDKTSTRIRQKVDTTRKNLDDKADAGVKKIYPKAHKVTDQ